MIRNHGENVIESFGITDLTNAIGSNYRLTEIQAAIGMYQVDEIEKCVDHRNSLHKVLQRELKGLDGIDVPVIKDGCTHAFYLYAFKFNEEKVGISRDQFVQAVAAELPVPEIAEQVVFSQGYVKPLYLNPVYQTQIAIGSKGFPFNYNKDVKYDYSPGLS